MEQLILGVDGGNTKTDYFLFTVTGKFVDYYHGPTCSHEQFSSGYTGAEAAMKQGIQILFSKHNITSADISAAVFGLAGVDTSKQKCKMEGIISALGFTNFRVINDSFLGLKAITKKGYGVCSINGTGTSCGAIDRTGRFLQIGGIGWIVGDDAGGGFIAKSAIRACYDEAFRSGVKTALTNIVMKALGVSDKQYLLEQISAALLMRKIDYTDLTLSVFEESKKGDAAAVDIIRNVGITCARSVCGAINNLDYRGIVDIVLAGSVWVKGASPIMIEAFAQTLKCHSNKDFDIAMLDVPPATGAVIWALEKVKGSYPTLKERRPIIKEVSKRLAEEGLQ